MNVLTLQLLYHLLTGKRGGRRQIWRGWTVFVVISLGCRNKWGRKVWNSLESVVLRHNFAVSKGTKDNF